MKRSKSEIIIDESKHKEAPGFLVRLKNSLHAIFMGAILAQVMLFAFRMGSILLWYKNIFFIVYLLGCAVLGWIVGERFIETLSMKSAKWWDLKGRWNQK